ncbi:hypothetical protein OG272_16220 [Streptomyces sp. NBC_00104]|uniref:hypothetical protein n=1 Tax=Streptomyces sp. NBC_00104 TaxID=2903621 RepID=UPI003249ADDA
MTWGDMNNRCTNPTHRRWADYGGRGIKVCERWRDFRNFLADMGERPPGLEIDRIDNDGDYEPGNCRWVTRAVQRSNRRPQKKRTHCGNGHEYTPANTRSATNGARHCRACEREWAKTSRQKRKASC